MADKILGRGLDSLIPPKKIRESMATIEQSSVVISDVQGRTREMDVNKIVANPNQPRQQFDHQHLEELIDSIREHGIIQPLVVATSGDHYELIAGERRLRAAKFLELKTVPVIIREAGEQEKLEISLIENIQRENLNPIEEAVAYQRLIDEFNLSRGEVAKKVGKSQSFVNNQIRLLNLSKEVKQALIDGVITAGHGKIIAGMPNEKEQLRFYRQVLKNELSVRATEQAAQRVPIKAQNRKPKNGQDPDLLEKERELESALGTKVKIVKETKERGKIMIDFYSLEELQAIIEKIIK
ncbi:MAG: ParB/RepB/Spo0J family partition protein [bacterium]